MHESQTSRAVGSEGELAGNKLRMGSAAFGRAVFAVETISKGELVIRLGGQRFDRSELPHPYTDFEDKYLQIGRDEYLGPSGEFDDYINHSCDPNSGLLIDATSVVLVALREVFPGEEITFDYSTTMDEDDWELDCGCGSPICRGTIRDFKKLPFATQQKYQALGIVPAYNLEHIKALLGGAEPASPRAPHQQK